MNKEIPAEAHGTPNGYNYYKCREACCKAANSARAKESRAKRAVKPMPVFVVHGKRSTYNNYGCRCDPCTEANNKREKATT